MNDVVVVGCGSIGRRHIRNLVSLKKTVIACDKDLQILEEIYNELGIETTSYFEEACKRSSTAMICTPTHIHVSLAKIALENDCHVFIEKPISHSLDGVDEVVALAKQKGKTLFVGFNIRYHPLIKRMKELLHENKIGNVVSVRAHFGSYLPWRHPGRDYRKDYGAHKAQGGGAILDIIHEIDYLRYLFGDFDEVVALGGKLSSLEMDVEDMAEILFSQPKKVISLHVDFIQRPHERTCEIIGENGSMKLLFNENILKYFDISTKKWVEIKEENFDFNQTYIDEVQHFFACIDGQKVPFVDGELAKHLLTIALKTRESLEIGRRITLPKHHEKT